MEARGAETRPARTMEAITTFAEEFATMPVATHLGAPPWATGRSPPTTHRAFPPGLGEKPPVDVAPEGLLVAYIEGLEATS